MKLILQITAAILLAGFIGWAVVSANQHREKPGARIDEMVNELHRSQASIEQFKREHPSPTAPVAKKHKKVARPAWTCRLTDESMCPAEGR